MKSNWYIYWNNHLWVSKLSFNKYHDGKLCLPLISCVSANKKHWTYDFACGLQSYTLNREHAQFESFRMLVDGRIQTLKLERRCTLSSINAAWLWDKKIMKILWGTWLLSSTLEIWWPRTSFNKTFSFKIYIKH